MDLYVNKLSTASEAVLVEEPFDSPPSRFLPVPGSIGFVPLPEAKLSCVDEVAACARV